MGVYKSFDDLKKSLQQKMADAMGDAIDKTMQDAKRNIDMFYEAPESPYYHRTGQLAESLMLDYFETAGNHTTAQISLDTEYRYNPAGRDTTTIYYWAESDDLWGNGGFWARTKEDAKRNLHEAMGKYFG